MFLAVSSHHPDPAFGKYRGTGPTGADSAIVVTPVDATVTLVQILGDFDADRARELDAAVVSLPADTTVIVIALDECEVLDPAGIDAIAAARDRLAATGHSLYLCAPGDQPLLALQVNGLADEELLIPSLEDVLP